MEKSVDAIGTQEFNDVWERVAGGDPEAVSDIAGAEVIRQAAAPQDLADTGLISSVLPGARASRAAQSPPLATRPAVTRAAVSPASVLPYAAAAEKSCIPAIGSEVSPEEIDCLCEIMEVLAESRRECCTLASRCRGQIRKTCRAIENSCTRSIQELNTQYFMHTGESFCPGSSIAPMSDVKDTLRNVCNNESAVQQACLDAAERTDNAALETTLLRCANCSAKRGQAAENLLGSLLRNGSL